MFTGIIEQAGSVRRIGPGEGGGKRLLIECGYDPNSLALGESIATNGVCLTLVAVEGNAFAVDAGPETLARTTIGQLVPGARVNLERSATLATRLGGHLVQGHVDGVGKVERITRRENAWDLWIAAPADILRLTVPRGSIAVDGISLTVTGRSAGAFSISIIPHTWEVTTIRDAQVGSALNLEVDLIARYVAGLLDGAQAPSGPGLTEAFLKKHGFE